MKHISSHQNPLIKQIAQLQEKSRERTKKGLFIIEGLRELGLALKAGYSIEQVFFCATIISEEKTGQLFKCVGQTPEMVSITAEVYEKIAYRSTTEGIIAIARGKSHALSEVVFKKENPLILVAEAPEKPGNIGALLRTADAANLDAVIIANPKTDIYNPNIVRSSVGCVFTNTIATGTSEEIIGFLKQSGLKIYCAALTASVNYSKVNFEGGSAIVVGTEDRGLEPVWLKNSTQNIIIPMQGEIDSMNVSVAAAIIIFEAKRQRNFL